MNAEHTTTVERLLEKADAGEPFLLLDVRSVVNNWTSASACKMSQAPVY